MELATISESALSPEGLIGHASYVLLILSMLMTRMFYLRIIAIGAGALSIVYSVMIGDFVSVFWEFLFVAVNLGQLALLLHRNRAAHFTPEERMFREHVVPLLEPPLARRLLDLGEWHDVKPGTILIRRGEMVTYMIFVASGEVIVTVNDVLVGYCDPGTLVGEISVLTDMPATATVTARSETRYLAFERQALQKLIEREPAIEQAIDLSFRKGLRQKLATTNDALVDAEARAAGLTSR